MGEVSAGQMAPEFTLQATGGKPAVASPVLMGITKAALQSDSFISAASFQSAGDSRSGSSASWTRLIPVPRSLATRSRTSAG